MIKKLIRSGNSKAVVLDRALIKHLELTDNKVEIHTLKGRLIIMKPAEPNLFPEEFINKVTATEECGPHEERTGEAALKSLRHPVYKLIQVPKKLKKKGSK